MAELFTPYTKNEDFEIEKSLQYIGEWLDIFSLIARREVIIYKRDYDFLQLLGQSVYVLNRFTNNIMQCFQKLEKESPEENKEIEHFLNHLELNSDMISANIKDFFLQRNSKYKSK